MLRYNQMVATVVALDRPLLVYAENIDEEKFDQAIAIINTTLDPKLTRLWEQYRKDTLNNVSRVCVVTGPHKAAGTFEEKTGVFTWNMNTPFE